jgi:hypothetical protein
MNIKPPVDAFAFHINSADWSDIAVFLAVLENGSLVAAGEAIGLSQPTIGRRLAALEARMGVTLFSRSARRLVPTDIARRIEESARRMAREMHAHRAQCRGRGCRAAGAGNNFRQRGNGLRVADSRAGDAAAESPRKSLSI